ncbi:hypothetical protein [Stella sp.]|uniref:hypothetical protein n=1 Tax=Stella sp. TaxID=2912054 RepID=UPI0035B25FC0
MGRKFTVAALALWAIGMASAADAAYRLCVRAGGFDARHAPNILLAVGATLFTAPNGGYYNSGFGPIDTCFETDAFGPAKVGWSSPHYACIGPAVAEGNQSEVWFIVDAVLADPGLGGRMPTCTRAQ